MLGVVINMDELSHHTQPVATTRNIFGDRCSRSVSFAKLTRNYRETNDRQTLRAPSSKNIASCDYRLDLVLEILNIYNGTQPGPTTRNTLGGTSILEFWWKPFYVENLLT